MTWFVKKFEELSTLDLYKMYKERCKVFVIEQNCLYLDMDDIDLKSIHIFKVNENNEIICYGRIFEIDNYICFGRVIVKKEYRRKKLGTQLIKKILKTIDEEYGKKNIKIHAQKYLEKFYGNFGFKKFSETYLLNEIVHIDMVLKK